MKRNRIFSTVPLVPTRVMVKTLTAWCAVVGIGFGTLTEAADVAESKPLPWQASREAGVRDAQLNKRPILIRFGGESCPWCRRLDEEIAKPAVQKSLQKWTLVSLDVDKNAADARTLNVESIPAMRVLTSTGRIVEARDGYLTEEKLLDWLDSSFERATEGLDETLLSTGAPEPLDLQKILRQFGDRNPTAREAAVRRLMPYRAETADAVVKALRQEKLSSRLSAIELLREWRAPLDDLDPWRPETLTAERLGRIDEWLLTVATKEIAPWSLTAAALADARFDIDQLLKADAVTAAATRERLARHKTALLPEVVARLKNATTDDERSRLLALRYRLVIADSIALRNPELVERLAAIDVRTRHHAVQELTEQAGADSQPLFLELFADVDPLVRELSLRGLRTAAGDDGTRALIKLLDDPEPNVRTAVLKQLAENPLPEYQPRLIEFLKTETETALLVHAVRCFRKLKTKSPDVLIPLLEHAEWQIRAEALDTLTGAWQRYPDDETRNLLKQANVRSAVIERLGDDDAFVVSRAILGVKSDVTQGVIKKLLTIPEKHPSLLKDVVATLSTASNQTALVMPSLKSFAASPDPTVRAEAIRGMGNLAPTEIGKELKGALEDVEPQVRIAGAMTLTQILSSSQPNLSNGKWNFRNSAGAITLSGDTSGYHAPVGITVEEDIPPSGGVSGLLRSLFGGPPRPVSPRPAAPRPVPHPADKNKTESDDKPDKSLEIGEARDKWVLDFRQDKKRPADQLALIPLLEKMFASKSDAERIASVVPLTALGVESVLSQVAELASSGHGDAGDVLEVLRWTTFAERETIYAELMKRPNIHKVSSQVMSIVPRNHDLRDADFLWALCDAPETEISDLSGFSYALRQLYLGERYWDTNAITPATKRRIYPAAEKQLESPAGLRHLMALTFMYENLPAEPEEEIQRIHASARALADNSMLPEKLRSDALQIALLTLDSEERNSQLLSLLQTGRPVERLLALRSLTRESGLGLLTYSHTTLNIRDAKPRSTPRGQQIQPEPPEGVTAEMVRPLLSHSDAEIRALAGYILAVSGESIGLPPLIEYWRVHGKEDDDWNRFVYRAVAATDDNQHLPVLKQIYSNLENYNVNEFYWTIRIMTGPKILELRKQIRTEKGAEALR
ncbi:MAG: HEAT repeat domain-containing protein [Planctomycetota bacterium]